jgi:hypothetical protein
MDEQISIVPSLRHSVTGLSGWLDLPPLVLKMSTLYAGCGRGYNWQIVTKRYKESSLRDTKYTQTATRQGIEIKQECFPQTQTPLQLLPFSFLVRMIPARDDVILPLEQNIFAWRLKLTKLDRNSQ